MKQYSVTCLEDLEKAVNEARNDWLKEQNSKVYDRVSYDNSDRTSSVETLYGPYATVARLFTGSPPKETFLAPGDEETEYDKYKASQLKREVNSREQSTVQTPSKPFFQTGFDTPPIEFKFEEYVVEAQQDKNLQPSVLGSILRDVNSFGMSQIAGVAISIKIFYPLPNNERFEVLQYPLSYTIRECIDRFLEFHLRKSVQQREKLILDLNPVYYVIKSHDENGLPTDDLPSLSNDSKLGAYCANDSATGTYEYCLFRVSTTENVIVDKRLSSLERSLKGGSFRDKKHVTELSEAVGKFQGGFAMKILLPGANPYTVLQITETMKLGDLFLRIVKKQRLPLLPETYEFLLLAEDQKLLNLHKPKMPMETLVYSELYDKGIRTIRLQLCVYRDSPVNFTLDEKPQEASTQRKLKKIDPSNYLFNDVTASKYQEWPVIKTNKWGKRQKRILGVDAHKVYNKKRPKANRKQRVKTKTSERLASDVFDAQLVNKQGSFRIFFKDSKSLPDHQIILEYLAEDGPESAAEIVSKLKYIKQHM